MTRDELRMMMDGLAGLPYGDEPVDQRMHALHAADLALAEGADDDLALAALLHDIVAFSANTGTPGTAR